MNINIDLETKTGEMSDKQLIDALGEIRRVTNILSRREKQLSEVLKMALKPQLDILVPESPKIILSGFVRPMEAVRIWQKRLDTERVQTEMGVEWWEDHCKTIDFVQFKFPKGNGEGKGEQ